MNAYCSRRHTALLATAVFAVFAGASALFAPDALGQSIWKQSVNRRSLYADQSARQVGDLLTVRIQESQVIQNNESSSLAKDSTLDAAITNFDIKPNAFDQLPAVAMNSSREFEGSATYNKNGNFEASLTVMVIDVLPNGNMVIEGSRDIRMDREHKRIRISGIVRPQDVAPSNTVPSSSVAQARISYEGTGPLTRTTNPSWFDVLLDFIWPF